MIVLSNGHSFEYMAASGALAYDGRGWPWEWPFRWVKLLEPQLFTIVTKTLTYLPRVGNLRWSHPWSCVKLLKSGVVNAIGLTNPGYRWWINQIAPHYNKKYSLIVSITEDDPQKLLEMVRAFEKIPIQGLELNASCPNTHQELHQNVEKVVESVKLMKQSSPHPILLKLSVNQDYLMIAKKTESFAEALSINSVPWSYAFPEQESPLKAFGGGGVSGKTAQIYTWKMVKELSSAVKTPVIGPSIWEYEDMQKVRNLGAQAVSFGSVFMRYPWRPTRYVIKELVKNT